MPTKTITLTLEIHQGVCSDGTTRAASLEVDGPDGGFTWCGGEPTMRSLVDFLRHLRLVDNRHLAGRFTFAEKPAELEPATEAKP